MVSVITPDQLGRHLQGHMNPRAIGLLPEPVNHLQPPGVSVCTTQFNHGNADADRWGYAWLNKFITLPIILEALFASQDIHAGALAAEEFMRYAYPRFRRYHRPWCPKFLVPIVA
jgi:hypothetical protein